MKRTIALGTAWTVSAAAAVGLGFLAVSLVDASASPGSTPASVTTTSAAPTSGTTASSSPSATGQYDTVGGTVVADCATGTPVLAGVPAAGWFVDDSNDPGEMEFESGEQKVEVHVVCTGTEPVFGLDDSSSSSPSTSPTSSSLPTTGSDDAPGDDSAGRVGGGHGADD
ncbi:hypothetical protein [Blastococcus sp. TF02-09]|uniref:hypothetical protein n=1 Tax=Blastococcus sp. TF02-09 TaxID=2250576 RepID=UPI0011BE2734|nr:hypothetical protein [Blastococcus sp. TF02-9]